MSDMQPSFSLDMDWGEDNERRDSATDSDTSATGSDLVSPLSAELTFDPMPMRPAEGPKWTVGSIPRGVNSDDYLAIVNAVYTDFSQHGTIPDASRVQLISGVGAKTVLAVMDTKEFGQAVRARGIPWSSTAGLTSQQMLALQVLTNPTDKRSLQAKLKSLEITYPVYRAWMRQPAFSQYMFKITEGMLTDHLPDFNTVLTNKGLAGDLNAIRYINELSGRHDPNRQQVLDLVAIVDKLLDIIQRNVTDPEVFQKIAAEFSMTVNSKTTMQGEITRGPHT